MTSQGSHAVIRCRDFWPAAVADPGPRRPRNPMGATATRADPDEPGARASRTDRRSGGHAEECRAEAVIQGEPLAQFQPAGEPQPDRERGRPGRSPRRRSDLRPATIGIRCGRFSTWLSSSRALAQQRLAKRRVGHNLGERLRAGATRDGSARGEVHRRCWRSAGGRSGTRASQASSRRSGLPADGPSHAATPTTRRCPTPRSTVSRPQRVGPIVHGANSSSPTPCCSLLVERAAGHVENQLEEAAADALHRLAVQDRAGVEVHVVDHPLVHRGVRGQLDARRRLQARERCPRPVVKTRTFAPPAIRPVVHGGS